MIEQLPDVESRTKLFRTLDDNEEHGRGTLKRRVLRIAGTVALTILAFGLLYVGTVFSG
jgi:hypothetical protein